jgi:hypothetical protein
MPEGPVGLCFFEQFVLQTGVNNEAGPEHPYALRWASMPHHPLAKRVSVEGILDRINCLSIAV